MNLENKIRILRIVARKRIFNNNFEIDELVNQAMLRKNVREAKEPSFLAMVGRSAMIDYIRIERGRSSYWDPRAHKKINKPAYKYKTFFHSLQTEEGFTIEPVIFPFNDIEFRDSLEKMLRGFTRSQKLITKMILAGFTIKVIGKAIGCSQSNVSQIWKRLKAILRIKYTKMN